MTSIKKNLARLFYALAEYAPTNASRLLQL